MTPQLERLISVLNRRPNLTASVNEALDKVASVGSKWEKRGEDFQTTPEFEKIVSDAEQEV